MTQNKIVPHIGENIEYAIIKPTPALLDYVESIWILKNHSDTYKDVVIMPDGRVDLSFSYTAKDPFHIMLMGLESEPSATELPPGLVLCAVSFKPLAMEYVLRTSIADTVNNARALPDDFWEIKKSDLNDFDTFCRKVFQKIETDLTDDIDNRKQTLFDLIYSSNGNLSVKELSEKVFWSNRQINRYFNQQFGISLKQYCKIIRFRASLQHIAEGKLFPEQNFTDQAHFIKEIKKLSGVRPKDLFKNKNDRFLQFSALKKK